MPRLGWGWAGFVQGGALVRFLVNDRVKFLAYRVFDPTAVPLLANRPVDVTPRLAKRAYEPYERQGHCEGQAERGIRREEFHR